MISIRGEISEMLTFPFSPMLGSAKPRQLKPFMAGKRFDEAKGEGWR